MKAKYLKLLILSLILINLEMTGRSSEKENGINVPGIDLLLNRPIPEVYLERYQLATRVGCFSLAEKYLKMCNDLYTQQNSGHHESISRSYAMLAAEHKKSEGIKADFTVNIVTTYFKIHNQGGIDHFLLTHNIKVYNYLNDIRPLSQHGRNAYILINTKKPIDDVVLKAIIAAVPVVDSLKVFNVQVTIGILITKNDSPPMYTIFAGGDTKNFQFISTLPNTTEIGNLLIANHEMLVLNVLQSITGPMSKLECKP